MKRLVTLLLFTGSLFAQPTITLNSNSVSAGSPATVTVNLSGSGHAIGAIQWFVPALPGMTATIGPAAVSAGKMLVCQASNGLFGCALAGMNVNRLSGSNLLGDGIIASITIPSVTATTSLPLSNMSAVDGAGDAPPITVASGSPLTISVLSAHPTCDVNGDGRIDLLDVRLVIDQIEGAAVAVSDLNQDGKVDILDLQRVANAAVSGTCRTGI